MPDAWDKARIINRLVAVHGYRRYLELCTTVTGGLYAAIDRSQLAVCRRLIYRCRDEYDDGLPIDYRSRTNSIGACLRAIVADDQPFDLVLVNSWHEYETSWRDLQKAFRLIRPGGMLLVHDCLPPRAEIAGPLPIPGEWCGVSYQAYVDFVHGRNDLTFYTVDCDYGCGVVRKKQPLSGLGQGARTALSMLRRLPTRRLRRQWCEAKQAGSEETFAVFEANRVPLLNLISVEDFLKREEAPPS